MSQAETVLDPEIAALSSDTAPTTISSVLADLNNQLQAMPAGLVSATTKSEATAAILLVQGIVAFSEVSSPGERPA